MLSNIQFQQNYDCVHELVDKEFCKNCGAIYINKVSLIYLFLL